MCSGEVKGFVSLLGGHRPGPTREPSPPWSPSHATGARPGASATSSTLRAFKGEGEIRTEGDVGADAPTSPSSSVLG